MTMLTALLLQLRCLSSYRGHVLRQVHARDLSALHMSNVKEHEFKAQQAHCLRKVYIRHAVGLWVSISRSLTRDTTGCCHGEAIKDGELAPIECLTCEQCVSSEDRLTTVNVIWRGAKGDKRTERVIFGRGCCMT